MSTELWSASAIAARLCFANRGFRSELHVGCRWMAAALAGRAEADSDLASRPLAGLGSFAAAAERDFVVDLVLVGQIVDEAGAHRILG